MEDKTQIETERVSITEEIRSTNEVVGTTATSTWQRVAIMLSVMLGLAVLAAVIMAAASCCIWMRLSKKIEDITSSNPSEGTNYSNLCMHLELRQRHSYTL